MSAPGPIDVFVVFAGPDRDRAAALCRALRAAGLRVYAEHDLRPGDTWDTALPTALRAARAVAVLISARWTSESHYGPEEVAIAIRHARKTEPPPRLIPVWLGDALDRTPYGLTRVSGVHVADDALAADDFAYAATQIAATLDPTETSPPARARDPVALSLERLENLRADGARPESIEQAQHDYLAARRADRDGSPPRGGDLFADRYRLIDRLGDGGFATVWLAVDQQRDEHVAVKILHGRWRHDRSRVERFERGAKRMATLDHPAVVRVLDAPSRHDGWPYYVMEYLPGGDLAAARTRADDPLTAEQALDAVLTIADALAEAHRRGMVHRDVKPQNILLDADGRAKLSDFDLVGAKDSTGGTRTGALGTFLFAAPEALAAAKDATPAADVYGLAVVTVFALLGEVPAELMRRHYVVVDALDAPSPLRALLRRSLAWEPAARPEHAGAFAAELRAALSRPAREEAPTPPRRSRRGRRGLIAAAVVLLGVAIAAWLWPTDDEPRDADAAASPLGAATSKPPRRDDERGDTRRGASGAEAPTAPATQRDKARAQTPRPALDADADAASAADESAERPVQTTTTLALTSDRWLPDDDRLDRPSDGPGGDRPEPEAAPTDAGPPPSGLPSGFVLVPAGSFMMGSSASEEGRLSDEGPRHRVTLTRPLWVGAHEVTQQQWRDVMSTSPSHFTGCNDCPVERVNWYEAAEYTNRLSHAAGLAECYTLTNCDPGEPGGGASWRCGGVTFVGVRCPGYRLPTEAEWAYFARAGTKTRFTSGDTEAHLARVGWYVSNSSGRTHPVGSMRPNAWGLYDVHGNVAEWTGDWYGSYPADEATDPTGPPSGADRVIRGGSWAYTARVARSAARSRWRPSGRYFNLGFRVVRAAPSGS